MVILVCGCLIGAIGFGPRAALGLFLTPMSAANGWSREVFSLALAIQVIVWGTAQPFVGAIADRFGTLRVFFVGALLYCGGLALMAYSTTSGMLNFSAGVLMGLGIAGTSFTLVIAAFSKLMPAHMRSLAFGAGTAAGSFGQFLFSPLAVGFIEGLGWQHALVAFAVISLTIIPLAVAIRTPPMDMHAKTEAGGTHQSLRQAMIEAFGHRSYVLLVLGFFTCGFQLLFITVHLPAYLVDRGLSIDAGAWALGIIGLFNIIGSVTSGWLGDRMPKRYLLVDHLRPALGRGDCLHYPSGHHGVGAHLWRGDGPVVAVDRAADLRAGGADVRHPLDGDFVRLRLFQPPGRRLPRRLAWRAALHVHRLVQCGVVAVGGARPDIGRSSTCRSSKSRSSGWRRSRPNSEIF